MKTSPRLSAKKWLLGGTLAALALALSGCAGMGQPGTLGRVLQPGWIQADIDGNGSKELIAQTNLADVAFNPEGEIIGWYVKVNPGSQLIKPNPEQANADKTYNFDQLKGALSLNLVGGRNGPDNKPLLISGRKALEVAIAGNTAAPTTQTPVTETNIAQNRLSATFTYTQGGATVTKKVTLHPRQFSIQADVNVAGAGAYTLKFPGLATTSNPEVKALPVGAAAPTLTPGTTEQAAYAALQSPISGLFHNSQTAAAIVIRPQQGGQGGTPAQGPLNVTTLGGADASLRVNATGPLSLDIYGGKNELVHLYQGGYTELPGVFSPNLFGYISSISPSSWPGSTASWATGD